MQTSSGSFEPALATYQREFWDGEEREVLEKRERSWGWKKSALVATVAVVLVVALVQVGWQPANGKGRHGVSKKLAAMKKENMDSHFFDKQKDMDEKAGGVPGGSVSALDDTVPSGLPFGIATLDLTKGLSVTLLQGSTRKDSGASATAVIKVVGGNCVGPSLKLELYSLDHDWTTGESIKWSVSQGTSTQQITQCSHPNLRQCPTPRHWIQCAPGYGGLTTIGNGQSISIKMTPSGSHIGYCYATLNNLKFYWLGQITLSCASAGQCPPGQYYASKKCNACPAGYSCVNDARTICPIGSYQDKTGQSSCKKASCGYYVPAAGATTQEPCRPGTFSAAGAARCTPAPPGYFSLGKACSATKCPAGTFQDCDGQTNCPKPPCGHFVKDPKSTVTTPCPAGTYQPLIGQTSCIDTKPGEYAGVGHCKPRLCIPGYFQNAPKQKSCKPASCGKKVPGAGANTDVSCGLGEYQPQPGQASCLPIPAGYYATNNKCGIKCCPAGTYRNSAFKCVKASCGYYVPRQCMSGQIKCPAGMYSAAGASACTPAPAGSIPTPSQCGTEQCKPGTFQDKPGQTSCKDTKCGYKAPNPGQTKQDPCPMGTYQPSTKSTTCIPCQAGSANGKTGQCFCPKCIPGTYQPLTGKTSCKDSPCGRFVKDPGATASVACPPGTYQDKTKQTGCIDAPAGTYAVGGKCNPTDCPVGTFSGSAGSTKCTDAPCGTYVDKPKQTSPTNCKAGEYQPLTGQTSCLLTPTGSFTNGEKKCKETLCTPGYYQPKEGQTSCLPADCGHFVAINGASSQTPCGVGRYQPQKKQKSCLLASLGYFVAGKTACKQDKCPAGQYTDCKGQSGCLKAPCGHKVVGSGKSSYVACSPGTFQDEIGKDFCKTSPAGSFSGSGYCKAQLCDPGTYQPSTGKSSCKQADCGKFVDGEGRSQQQTCPAGSYQNKKGQVGCYRSSLAQAPTPGLCRKIPIYFKGPSPMKWVDAKAFCVKQGGRLAIIRNAAENAAAFKVCRGGGVEGDCWIGGTDMVTEKVWKWVDGSYLKDGYTNWSQGEPNNLNNEDCAHFWKKAGEWNDLKCVTVKPFVCEKPGSYY